MASPPQLAPMPEAKIGLSIYLLKPSQVRTFEQAVVDPRDDVILLKEPLNGVFIPIEPEAKEPAWVSSVRSILQTDIRSEMDALAPAGLLVVWRSTGTFVISFGRAYQVLEDDWLELGFGRKVALNAVPRESVVWIKAEQLLAKGHLASERAPKAAPVDEFGVDFERDLVGAVEGVPSRNPLLGDKVRGAKNIHLTLPLSHLDEILDECATLFASDLYKNDWPDIDNIQRVKDEGTITALDAAVDDVMSSPAANSQIVMYTPLQRKGEALLAESYVYGRLIDSAVRVPYLTFEGFKLYLGRRNLVPSVAQARSTAVHVLDEHGHESGDNFRVFECLGLEVSLNGRVYVLSSGAWFEVEGQFIEKINLTVRQIPPAPVVLPPWNTRDDEQAYNMVCARDPSFLNCDRRIVRYGGGQGQFEFCDLVHRNSKTLCFVKKGSKSGGMSHLFEQVRRTTELVFGPDQGFRQKVIEMFALYHPGVDASWLSERQRPGDWTLCMVSLGEAADTLPFFARCGLKTLYKELVKQGHAVSFASV
jgi:uncharacterized protein (TIGR04141 family)